MQKKAFRKVALERLFSPEQLDQLMQVTSIRGWQIIVVVGLVLIAGIGWAIFGSVKTSVRGSGIFVQDNVSYIMSASNGLLTEWKVKVGDMVSLGDTIGMISRPDNANDLRVISPYAGQVSAFQVQLGNYIRAGEPLLAIENSSVEGATTASLHLKAILYLPLETSRQLAPGMEANLLPAGMRVEESGYLEGKIKSIAAVPVTTQEILRRTGNVALSQKLQTDDSLVEVVISLSVDQASNQAADGSVGNYHWSLPQEAQQTLSVGVLCSGEIITSQQAPINLIFANSRSSVAATPTAAATPLP